VDGTVTAQAHDGVVTLTGRTDRRSDAEVSSVAADVPLLLTAPLYRPWYVRWGATPADVAYALTRR
jgi:hypothetical protein